MLLANLVTHLAFLANWEGVEVWESVVQHQYQWVDKVSERDIGRRPHVLSILTSLTSSGIELCLPAAG